MIETMARIKVGGDAIVDSPRISPSGSRQEELPMWEELESGSKEALNGDAKVTPIIESKVALNGVATVALKGAIVEC